MYLSQLFYILFLLLLCINTSLARNYWNPNGNAYGNIKAGEYGCGLTDLHKKDGKGVIATGYTFYHPSRIYMVLIDDKGRLISDFIDSTYNARSKSIHKTNHDNKYVITGWAMKNEVQTAFILKIGIKGKGKNRKIVKDIGWGTNGGYSFPGGTEYWDLKEISNTITKESEYIFVGETGRYPELFLYVGKINNKGTKILKKWEYTEDNPILKTDIVNYSIGLCIVESLDKSSYFITGAFGANVYIDRTEDNYKLDEFYARAFILKIDTANGKIAKQFQENPENNLYIFKNEEQPQLSEGYDIASTENVELLITGTSKGKVFLQKFDSNGKKIWNEPKIYNKRFKGVHNEAHQIHIYKDKKGNSHYILTGYTKTKKDINANRDVFSLIVNQTGIVEDIAFYGYNKFSKRWDDGVSVNQCPGAKVCNITPQ